MRSVHAGADPTGGTPDAFGRTRETTQMNRAWRRVAASLTFAIAAGLLGGGCVTTRPWERETLAKPIMSPDPDADRDALRAHLLGLREGAQGGFGAGGGGCGCN